MLFFCIEGGLKLLHPMMPYLTEDLYQKIWRNYPGKGAESISIDRYPVFNSTWNDPQAEQEFGLCISIIKAVRNIRAAVNLSNKIKPAVHIHFSGENGAKLDLSAESRVISQNQAVIAQLFRNCQAPKIAESIPKGCLKDFITNEHHHNCFVGVELDQKHVNIEKEVKFPLFSLISRSKDSRTS